MTPEVTVIVPVKDRRERMLRCVDALLAQDHPNFEILVADNESTDGTPEACVERAAGSPVPLRVAVIPGPVGHVRNEAARMAHGEFIAYTDSDCLPAPGWLSAAARALREDPQLGIVQGRTLPEHEPEQGWEATIHVEEFSKRYESCNLVFRRSAFVESAGFDERVGHFWEDAPAGYAVLRGGWRAIYVPDALVYHDVTYPGFWWHVKRMQKHQNLAPVIARYPEMRKEMLLWGVFLGDRDARFSAFALGLLALPLNRRLAALLCAPYLVDRLKYKGRWELRRGWYKPRGHAQAVLIDGSRLVGLLRGGLRNGRIVL